VGVKLDLTHQVHNLKLFFPETAEHKSSVGFEPGPTPLVLKANPSTGISGTIEAHLIPTVEFGFTAFGGVSSTVALALDASANVQLSLRGTPPSAPASSVIPFPTTYSMPHHYPSVPLTPNVIRGLSGNTIGGDLVSIDSQPSGIGLILSSILGSDHTSKTFL
jgi:hypothetical protein